MKYTRSIPILPKALASVWFLILFSGMSFLIMAPPVFGQPQITIRFLDAQSGKPLTGLDVDISGGNGKFDGTKESIVWNSTSKKTDHDGKVIFQLPQQLPKYLLFVPDFDELHGCSDRTFSVEDVVSKGVVAGYDSSKPQRCGKLRAELTVKPGEIVIFDKKMTIRERISQETP